MPATDTIIVRDLLVRGIIGLNDWEREKEQNVLITLEISVDARAAGESDDMKDSLNYRTITKDVIAHAESFKPFLVEALAHQIARIVVVDHGAERVRVRVEKPDALRFASSVGIEVERTAADFS